jgi:hypothetical protein
MSAAIEGTEEHREKRCCSAPTGLHPQVPESRGHCPQGLNPEPIGETDELIKKT